MKRHLLYLYFILCLFTSCAKSYDVPVSNNTLPNKVFVPVVIFGGPGAWGGGVCSWGFIMVRQDSSVTYHSIALPANTTIPNTPTLVNIFFHDTTQISSCWQEIVVDSVKF
ncbi:MAG: hypothetical protein ABIO79_06430 [Ferruginibacter sp.]